MFQGFYDLAANMITQNRKMNVISNNMANVSTPGFKSDKLIETTFRDEMIYRYDRDGKTPIGVTSRVNTVDERITDYTQGGVRATSNVLDFALNGNGFFAIQTGNGV
ncbi:MAG: flagellar hook-basal body complex protein, partial [[Clostridium] nexile]